MSGDLRYGFAMFTRQKEAKMHSLGRKFVALSVAAFMQLVSQALLSRDKNVTDSFGVKMAKKKA